MKMNADMEQLVRKKGIRMEVWARIGTADLRTANKCVVFRDHSPIRLFIQLPVGVNSRQHIE